MKPKKKNAGRLLTNNVIMETHEYATINVILAEGEDVELLKKISHTPLEISRYLYARNGLGDKIPNRKNNPPNRAHRSSRSKAILQYHH